MLRKMYGDELVMPPYIMSVDALNAQDTAGTCCSLVHSLQQGAVAVICCCLHMLLGQGIHDPYTLRLQMLPGQDNCYHTSCNNIESGNDDQHQRN